MFKDLGKVSMIKVDWVLKRGVRGKVWELVNFIF